jgi:hypothetical protein
MPPWTNQFQALFQLGLLEVLGCEEGNNFVISLNGFHFKISRPKGKTVVLVYSHLK